MKLIAMMLLLVAPPCSTPKDKVYAKVKAADTKDGGFSLEAVCPKGMTADMKHLPEAMKHVSSYADAINGIQKIECIPSKNGGDSL